MLFHASSLIRKGCKIAAIKAGSSESGSRAASSHTGAIASSDSAVEALFRKAGIVRCFSREELTTVGCVFTLPELKGKNFAIITHAGGPGVMLTDALSKGGLNVPKLEGEVAEELKAQLFPGAAVGNPIDILATGTPEHLRLCIDYCEEKLDNIDAMMAIFGTPGLVTMFEMYDVLHEKMQTCKKPIFPILPSINTAGAEVSAFLAKGHVNFADEVTLGTALSRIVNAPKPAVPEIELFGVDVPRIRRIIDSIPEDGYIAPNYVQALLHAAGIPLVDEFVSDNKEEIVAFARRCGFPVVAKVVGPVHKSDVGGVVLNIKSEQHLALEFDRMMQILDARAIMVQPMLKGTELFVGAKYEEKFGHVVLCGLGGIFVEVLKDVSSGLAPLSYEEAYSMIHSLRAYKIIQGTRGQKGVNEDKFAEIIVRLSTLLRFATEIKEMDINPLLATEKAVVAVDARIRIENRTILSFIETYLLSFRCDLPTFGNSNGRIENTYIYEESSHILICLIGYQIGCHAQMADEHYYFKNLSVQNGLSQNTVNAILQDKQGFMWFGTKDGLNRYDGLSFRKFKHDDRTRRSIGNNFITALYEDSKGDIWVGTDVGLYIYNPEKDSFRHFAELSAENTKIEHTVTAISGDNKGCVWVAVESQGLFCYDLEEGTLQNHTLKNFSFISTNVQSFVFDNSGTLWIGCYGDGLFYSKDRLQTLHPYVSPVDDQKLMRMMS